MMNFKALLSQGLNIAALMAGATPIGAMIQGIKIIVNTAGQGVSDKTLKETITEMGASTWNNLTPDKIKEIHAIIDAPIEKAAAQ